MKKYRKKPVVIEAVRFRQDNVTEVIEWIALDGAHQATRNTSDVTDDALYIETLEGTMRADLGDWIIKGIKGEFYPCKPDIFDATYEPVEG